MRRILSVVLMIIGLAGLSGASAEAAGLVLKDVHGLLDNGGRFDGAVNIKSLKRTKVGNGEVLTVEGVLNGTATLPNGTKQTIRQAFEAPAELTQAGPDLNLRRACQILDLDIGRIRLDLLGLVIDLSPIHLDIIAIPGGGLLGDLLCGLANLLDGIPGLEDLLRILRRINDILDSL